MLRNKMVGEPQTMFLLSTVLLIRQRAMVHKQGCTRDFWNDVGKCFNWSNTKRKHISKRRSRYRKCQCLLWGPKVYHDRSGI